jgi:hypothetical protein
LSYGASSSSELFLALEPPGYFSQPQLRDELLLSTLCGIASCYHSDSSCAALVPTSGTDETRATAAVPPLHSLPPKCHSPNSDKYSRIGENTYESTAARAH